MPTYDYKCENCEHRFDAFQSMLDDPLTDYNGGHIRRIIGSNIGIAFKGSGFYITDSKKKMLALQKKLANS